ncbi:MAG: 2-C-methyl-D-erythritol 4-phosphate cytidylyltransferase [Segetibacter sp.]|nr:2-C-methyl-D-erythritol 4-phosphate cytidylyltransferase [Segetibacter sp.]
MKKYAIIVAGGSGQRMGSSIPKQFLLLGGKPLIFFTVRAFLESYDDMKVVLVLPEDFVARGEDIIAEMKFQERVTIVAGGELRFHSVKKGLEQIEEPSVVFVHDGVRCLVSAELIHRCYEQALEKGSAIPSVAATDSVRISEDGKSSIVDRSKIRLIQTPQTFRSEILVPAYNQEFQEGFTDDATVVEAIGQQIFLIEGEYDNIKITRPLDLVIAEKLFHQKLSALEG